MKQVEPLHSKSVNSLHNDAMRAAEQATVARQDGDLERADELVQQALAHEREAAYLLLDERDKEPSRSVLFRSAASLALDCEKWSEAEKLAKVGLDGNPPEQIAEELNDVLERVYKLRRSRDVETMPGSKKQASATHVARSPRERRWPRKESNKQRRNAALKFWDLLSFEFSDLLLSEGIETKKIYNFAAIIVILAALLAFLATVTAFLF